MYQPKLKKGGFEQCAGSTIKHTVLKIYKANALIRPDVHTKAWLTSHLQKDSPQNIIYSSARLHIHQISTPQHLSIQQTYTDEVFLNNFYKWESHLPFWKERHGLWKVYLSICWRYHTLTRECKKHRDVLQPNPKLTVVWTSVKAICFAKTPLLLHIFLPQHKE